MSKSSIAYFKMLLLLLISNLGLSLAHNILLKAHSRECFNEVLHKGDKMAVTFQVGDREFGGSGNLAIDFWVILTMTNRFEGLTLVVVVSRFLKI